MSVVGKKTSRTDVEEDNLPDRTMGIARRILYKKLCSKISKCVTRALIALVRLKVAKLPKTDFFKNSHLHQANLFSKSYMNIKLS